MKPLLIGNWKMNLGPNESSDVAKSLARQATLHPWRNKVQAVLCPSFDALTLVKKALGRAPIFLGAQDVFWQAYGPFTGEVAASSLKEIGCRYCIVGHSERRQHLGETNEMVNHKVKAALDAGLTPIVCVGETIDERREHQQDLAIMTQMVEGLAGIELRSDQRLIIAYEPVWVIGSGQAIAPAEADRMSRVIRQALIDLYPLEIVREQTSIIYGGSVDAQNIQSFHELELINGFLVGGASLQAKTFISLIKALS